MYSITHNDEVVATATSWDRGYQLLDELATSLSHVDDARLAMVDSTGREVITIS